MNRKPPANIKCNRNKHRCCKENIVQSCFKRFGPELSGSSRPPVPGILGCPETKYRKVRKRRTRAGRRFDRQDAQPDNLQTPGRRAVSARTRANRYRGNAGGRPGCFCKKTRSFDRPIFKRGNSEFAGPSNNKSSASVVFGSRFEAETERRAGRSA